PGPRVGRGAPLPGLRGSPWARFACFWTACCRARRWSSRQPRLAFLKGQRVGYRFGTRHNVVAPDVDQHVAAVVKGSGIAALGLLKHEALAQSGPSQPVLSNLLGRHTGKYTASHAGRDAR